MEAVTLTCQEAAKRHPGLEERHFSRLCLRGQRLLKRHGNRESIPPKEMSKALFGKKVGKFWVIPVSELDRFFLPGDSDCLKKKSGKKEVRRG